MEFVAHPLDVHDLVQRAVVAADETSKVLRYFDPVGTLVLNEIQMDDFFQDWDDAKRLVVSTQDQRAWDEVHALAARVAKSNVLFLALLGD